jgi:hypothetical protein
MRLYEEDTPRLWSFFQTRNGKRKKKEKKGENGKENSN